MAKNTDKGAQTSAQASFTVTMTQDKVTKGCVRFKEDHANETEPDRIGQLYVQKSAFPAGAPQQVRVNVEAL